MKMLSVSGSPHLHGKQSVPKIMYTVIIALIPAFLAAVYYFGLGAVRTTAIAVFCCVLFEWLIQKFLLKGGNTIVDGSAVITGLLLAFNVPSNLPWWIIMIGSLVAIGIGKMTFGGLGNNIFNPALVGRVFLLISFPVEMTSWPKVNIMNFSLLDATTGATPLGIMKGNLHAGKTVADIMENMHVSYADMFWGQMGGSLGEVSAIALILGGIFMLIRRVITWHIPVSMIGTIALFTGILHIINPALYAPALFHILTGGVLLGAIFMATDMVTSPMTGKGMLIYGFGIGIITVCIRIWGIYPEGVSFAILIMNAFTPLINKYFKSRVFGT